MSILAGAQAPERLRLRVTSGAQLDLTTVTGVTVRVQPPGRAREVWEFTVTEQTETLLLLDHEFTYPDVEHAGSYKINVELTVPTGIRRAGPVILSVTE